MRFLLTETTKRKIRKKFDFIIVNIFSWTCANAHNLVNLRINCVYINKKYNEYFLQMAERVCRF